MTGDGYSRLILWAKIVLPLAAIAILSTLFLVSRTPDPTAVLPYADVDVADLAANQRVGEPSYAGVTNDGSTIAFRADEVRPEAGSERVVSLAPIVEIVQAGGRSLTLSAERGYVDRAAQVIALDGTVRIEASDGYSLQTSHVEASLDATRMETAGAVSGTGPVGSFTAGRAILVEEPQTGLVLRFEGGIKVVYRPGN